MSNELPGELPFSPIGRALSKILYMIMILVPTVLIIMGIIMSLFVGNDEVVNLFGTITLAIGGIIAILIIITQLPHE